MIAATAPPVIRPPTCPRQSIFEMAKVKIRFATIVKTIGWVLKLRCRATMYIAANRPKIAPDAPAAVSSS